MMYGVEALKLRNKKKRFGFLSVIIKFLFLSFIVYSVITIFFVFPVTITSDSMLPVMKSGDRVIASPLLYGPEIPFFNAKIKGIKQPARGDIVAVIPPCYSTTNPLITFFEPLVRFLSLQKISLMQDADGKRISGYSIKRIIGLPGDRIRLEKFTAFIKPEGAADFISEEKLLNIRYQVNIDPAYYPSKWESYFPLSGNMEEMLLGKDEYFVLGDNRTASSDSYAWGTVSFKNIPGKIIFRFWPVQNIGIQ